MKSLIIAAVAALGFTVGGATEAEAGSCYRGGGFGYGYGGYGYGVGNGFIAPRPIYTPVSRRDFRRSYVPVRQVGYYGHPGFGYGSGFNYSRFNRRGGISIGFGW